MSLKSHTSSLIYSLLIWCVCLSHNVAFADQNELSAFESISFNLKDGADGEDGLPKNFEDDQAFNLSEKKIERLYKGGKYSEALPIALNHVKQVKNAFGVVHNKFAGASNALAQLYEAMGRFEEAEQLYKRSLAIRRRVLKPDHRDISVSLKKLGSLYKSVGRYKDAEPLFEQALRILEKIYGTTHQNLSSSLNALAVLYIEQGLYDQAEILLKRAFGIVEAEVGSRHPFVSESLNNLSALYQVQHRYSEAEPFIRRALSIDEKVFGKKHPRLIERLKTLTSLYKAQGRYLEAMFSVKRSISIIETVYGEKHPLLIEHFYTLSTIFQSQGNYSESLSVIKDAVALGEQIFRSGHPNTARALNRLALLHYGQGQYEKAETTIKQAISMQEKMLDPNHPDYTSSLNVLGSIYQAQSKQEQASGLYEKARAAGTEDLNACLMKNICTPIRFFFGTNRAERDIPGRVSFGNKNLQKLQLGRAVVTVPKAFVRKKEAVHKLAWWEKNVVKVSSSNDPAKNFTRPKNGILKFSKISDFVDTVQNEAKQAGDYQEHAFIFIHGYNMTFDAALFRTAQIAYDLGYHKIDGTHVPFGTAFMYSWPSAGREQDYVYDLENAWLSVNHLKEFIYLIAAKSKIKKINIIAYSMGGMLLLKALRKIELTRRPDLKLNQVIFVTPDIDIKEFQQSAYVTSQLAERVTLYASSNDEYTQKARRIFQNRPRVGDVFENGPFVIDGVSTIDVSTLNTTIFSNKTRRYINDKKLLNDVRQIFTTNSYPPSKRNINFALRRKGNLLYWKYVE